MTINDIRKKSWLLFIIIGGAMGAFVLTDFFRPEQWQGDPNVLLQIEGNKFSNEDLKNEINIREIYWNNGNKYTGQQISGVRNTILDNYIADMLYEKKFEESGIIVTEKELRDLASGEYTSIDNQHPYFKTLLNQIFQTIDPSFVPTSDDISDWIDNQGASTAPLFYNAFLWYKKQVKREVNIAQYKNAIKQGIHATSIDAKSNYIDKNQTMSGQYIYLPCDIATLSDFSPSNKDIKNYYKKHKNDFLNNKPGRELTYFIFDCIPTAEDSASYVDNFNDLSTEFSKKDMESDEFKNFVNINSDETYRIMKVSKEDYNNIIKDKAITSDIILPYFEKGFCKMGRVLGVDADSVSVVYLSKLIEPSRQTRRDVYSDVKDIQTQNSEISDFKEFSKKYNTRPRQVYLEKTDKMISGLGENRSMVMQLFSDNVNLNEPQYFELEGDRHILAIVSKIVDDEYQSLEDVRDDITSILITNNNIETRINEINNFTYTNINDLAIKFNSQVKTINKLSMSSDVFGEEGYQPDVVGSFFSSKQLQPIRSQNGVFVFDNLQKDGINLPSDFNNEKKLLEVEYRNFTFRSNDGKLDDVLLNVLKEESDIVDNRGDFY